MGKSSLERNLLNFKSHHFSSNHYNTVKKPKGAQELHHFLYSADRKRVTKMKKFLPTTLHHTDSRGKMFIFLNVLYSVGCCSNVTCVCGSLAV